MSNEKAIKELEEIRERYEADGQETGYIVDAIERLKKEDRDQYRVNPTSVGWTGGMQICPKDSMRKLADVSVELFVDGDKIYYELSFNPDRLEAPVGSATLLAHGEVTDLVKELI